MDPDSSGSDTGGENPGNAADAPREAGRHGIVPAPDHRLAPVDLPHADPAPHAQLRHLERLRKANGGEANTDEVSLSAIRRRRRLLRMKEDIEKELGEEKQNNPQAPEPEDRRQPKQKSDSPKAAPPMDESKDEPSEQQDQPEPSDKKEDTGDKENEDQPQRPPFYKRPKVLIIGGAVLVVLLIGIVIFWLYKRQFESTDDAYIAGHVVQVSPQVSGRVTRVLVNDNQLVSKGDVLFELDPSDLQAAQAQSQAGLTGAQSRLKQAQANVDSATAALGEARAGVDSAQTQVNRTEADFKRYNALPPEAVSRQTVDNANAAYAAAKAALQSAKQKQASAEAQIPAAQAQVAVAEADVKQAQANLNNANLQLGYTKVFADQDGYVTNKTVEVGNYMTPGQPAMALVNPHVWIVANFKETQLTHMQPGQQVSIKVDAYPHADLVGKVDSIMAGSGAQFSLLPPENATGNFVKVVQRVPVKIDFTNYDPKKGPLLGPGMSVEPKVKVR